jgi:predicted signal transduction protein with EAL and GGDEF domain
VARLGTDEFAIFANNLDSSDDAAFLANRIIQSLEAPILVDGRQHQTGTSVGLAMFPTDETVASELLAKAELALNQAKASGRGTYRFFNANINAQIEARKSVERDLLRAFQREELVRPVAAGRVHPCCRGNRPDRRDRRMGAADGMRPRQVVAGRGRATGAGLGQRFGGRAQGAGLCGEGSACPGGDRVRRLVARARDDRKRARRRRSGRRPDDARAPQLGIQTAIDDFGTGHSSMADLKQVPIDRLKIDRSFIRQLAETPDDVSIAAAIIGLGRSLEIGVVAGGVETAEQLGLLRDQGCAEAQGFLMSRPLAGAALESFLDARLDERTRAPGADSDPAKSGSFRPRVISSNGST